MNNALLPGEVVLTNYRHLVNLQQPEADVAARVGGPVRELCHPYQFCPLSQISRYSGNDTVTSVKSSGRIVERSPRSL